MAHSEHLSLGFFHFCATVSLEITVFGLLPIRSSSYCEWNSMKDNEL